MQAQKGYYSLLQFCPEPSRLEAVNVGVVLFCPGIRFLAARTARGNQRPAKLVGRAALNPGSINSAKRAIERRLEVDGCAFDGLEDFQRFVDTRANALKLTPPRPIKVFDPEQTLDDLFRELVGGKPRTPKVEPAVSELDLVFRQLEKEGRAKLNFTVKVPVLERRLNVPYSYQNGVLNLIKPHHFSGHEAQAMGAAMRFAIEGDLIHKHGVDSAGQARLVIVPSFEHEEAAGTIEKRVQEVLGEYDITTVSPNQLSEFSARVMLEAH